MIRHCAGAICAEAHRAPARCPDSRSIAWRRMATAPMTSRTSSLGHCRRRVHVPANSLGGHLPAGAHSRYWYGFAQKASYHASMPKSARAAVQSPNENRLLAAMPDADYQALVPALERVPMPLGQAVYESGGPQGFVYFPTSSIVSLLYVLADGATAEIAVTGNEGLVGIALFMGGETTPSRAVVQSAGHGYRLKAAVVKKQFEA